MDVKGIVLAGGKGTRFRPATMATNKHLLAVYDKPMIFYPLSLLMLADLRDILLITSPRDVARFQDLLGDGSRFGVNLSYATQEEPRGLPEAYLIGERFLDGHPSCLVLGDNIFYGQGLPTIITRGFTRKSGAGIFVCEVDNPQDYGVARFDSEGRVTELLEKPRSPASDLVVTGLYYFDATAPARARTLTPSARGELEILDLATQYLREGQLSVEQLGRGIAWLDMGSPDALIMASNLIHVIDHRQRLKIACLEEIAWRKGWIDDTTLRQAADVFADTAYGRYILRLLA